MSLAESLLNLLNISIRTNFHSIFILLMVLLTDAVPEAIYRELPPRLQKEVQVDRTRAPSLTAN